MRELELGVPTAIALKRQRASNARPGDPPVRRGRRCHLPSRRPLISGFPLPRYTNTSTLSVVSGQVNSTLQPLADAIDDLDLPIDSTLLVEAFALVDRLNAKLLAAVGEHDVAEVWRNDGATSMTAWLRHHTRRIGRDAALCTRTARRLRELPVTAALCLSHAQPPPP